MAMSREEQVAAWDRLSGDQRRFFADVMAGKTPTITSIDRPQKSNLIAFLLGLLLGPVGLWYKGQWAAGFAWLVIAAIALSMTVFLAPLFWLGMAFHAAVASPKS
jgi:hypothetical protein